MIFVDTGTLRPSSVKTSKSQDIKDDGKEDRNLEKTMFVL